MARVDISIHATHTGGDVGTALRLVIISLFQSTPPIRVATPGTRIIVPCQAISIHATHTGGDGAWQPGTGFKTISIHATHTGGDNPCRCTFQLPAYFNPRHPYGWRLLSDRYHRIDNMISIHATHTGGDTNHLRCCSAG